MYISGRETDAVKLLYTWLQRRWASHYTPSITSMNFL